MAGGLSVLNGGTFVLSDGVGDVGADPELTQGFFADDTRFVSAWRLRIDGAATRFVSAAQDEHFSAQVLLTADAPDVYRAADVSILRRRTVDEVWVEEILVMNHGPEPRRIVVELDVAADFADLFEVKDRHVRERAVTRTRDDRGLVLGYRSGTFVRETRIASNRAGVRGEDGFRFEPQIASHEDWSVRFVLLPHSEQRGRAWWPRNPGASFDATTERLRDERRRFKDRAPRLVTDWPALERAYERSIADLGALRLQPDERRTESVPAAGLPWFMALFGRDSLITSFEALPFLPDLATQTLRILARNQGRRVDDARDEQPGKILHELRHGELTATGELPYSPYYGTADATPLFLILLDEHRRWTGSDALAHELERAARAALDWIDVHGDLDGDGFVEYERRNEETGLLNQCWKDSWDSMRFRDGGIAEPPIAPCEVQGYVFDARLRAARLADEVWHDPALARRLRTQAAALRRRFREAFWMPERSGYALALDAEKRQVDSITSNMGHLLWSGIVRRDHAALVAGHLLGEHLFTGFGIRTMSTLDAGYNPIGYHVGTVWPHDSALVAAGLARYGYRDAAARVAAGLIDAASALGGRLPEVFAGYSAGLTRLPIEYPTSADPQAWAAAAPMLLIRVLLGLEPRAGGVTRDPVLPLGVTKLVLS